MSKTLKWKPILLGLLIVCLFEGVTSTWVIHAYTVYSISEIQGDGWSTPFPYTYVQTAGIVIADFQTESKRGFFLQDPVGDGNPDTSEGIFVYERGIDVEVGDEVVLVGRAREYYGLTEIDRVEWVTILSSSNPLPEPVELNPPTDDYDSDVYYESLEGMLVRAESLTIVAGTDQYGEFAGVLEDLGIDRVFEDDPYGTGELIFADDGGGVLVNVRSGQEVRGLQGPLDYTYDEYKVLPCQDFIPKVIPKRSGIGLGRGRAETMGVSIATYNMYNLFDDSDADVELAKHARVIHDYLREPDLIAVQEVEKIEMLEQLADTPSIRAEYGAILVEGPDLRGIDVGLLYRKDRVLILGATVHQTHTSLNDGYGPGIDPNYPCPPGTNPLFSRPPLLVHLEILAKNDGNPGSEMWIIINHFKSKSTYAPFYADTTPRRIEQAEWVSSLVDGVQETDPEARVVVIGDLNDFEYSQPLSTLESGGLINLVWDVEKEERYTYIYRGVSEVLDHIFVTPALEDAIDEVRIIHCNVDYPTPLYGEDPTMGISSSDHDIILAAFEVVNTN